jgi:ATPase subunit of ABC transporter with duplicated ATPase domains
VEWGYETHPGYVAQDYKEQIGSRRQSLDDWLGQFCPAQGIGYVKGQLAAVLFSGDESKKRLEALSGGEAARLMFARQSVEKPNVLILDEPTNHLDLEAIEALVLAITDYDGTLIFVSHDRWFVNELATRIIEITPEGVRDFSGTYDEYLARAGEDHLDAQEVLRRTRDSKRAKRAGGTGGRSR